MLRGISEAGRDEQGRVPNAIAFLYSSIKPKRPIQITVGRQPIVISANGSNFHGKSNMLTVTYVPVDHSGPARRDRTSAWRP